jgi:acyl carrier protein
VDKNIDFQQIKKEIKTLISEISEIPEDSIKEDAQFFEDLGVDSMMALEIAAQIEKKYKVVISEEEIPKIRSLANIIELLQKLLDK